MNFSLKSLSGLVLAGLLAGTGVSAMAQDTPAPAPATRMTHHGDHAMAKHYDPAKMKARMAKRESALKAKLNITAAQEGAWTTYTQAMQPPARMDKRAGGDMRAEFAKLTTPERIDKMRAMRMQRMTEMNTAMDQRGDATKALYAALTPEQQKVFDSQHIGWAKGEQGQHQGKGHGMRGAHMKH